VNRAPRRFRRLDLVLIMVGCGMALLGGWLVATATGL
jgi:hypothetical protein